MFLLPIYDLGQFETFSAYDMKTDFKTFYDNF